MNCIEFERRLREIVEAREPDGAPDLAQHSHACSACGALWDRHVVLDAAVHAWADAVPVVDLTSRVLTKLAADAPRALQPVRTDLAAAAGARHRARRVSVQRLATASVALLIALGMGIGITYRNSDNRNLASARRTPHETVARAPVERPEIDHLLRQAGSAYWALAEDAAHAVQGAAAMVQPVEAPLLAVDENWIPEFNTEWMGTWKTGLEPIGDDVAEAIQFLIDTVPASSDTQPKI